MSNYSYKTILNKAKECQKNVKSEYKLGITDKWSYYFAKSILNPKKDIKKINFGDNPKPVLEHISRQATRVEYKKLARELVEFVEKKGRLPNYLKYAGKKVSPRLWTYVFAKIIIKYDKNGKFQDEVIINKKVFTKPVETKNEVYNYFVKVFGKFDNTVDGFLSKIKGRGYSYYYDDTYSNKQCIDRLKKGKGINCTDSCQMAMNIIEQLIALKKYKKVECLHVQCSSGGHVKLRITKNDGSKFIRDVACAISDNGKPLSCVWCTNTPKANGINPSWFMENLNR